MPAMMNGRNNENCLHKKYFFSHRKKNILFLPCKTSIAAILCDNIINIQIVPDSCCCHVDNITVLHDFLFLCMHDYRYCTLLGSPAGYQSSATKNTRTTLIVSTDSNPHPGDELVCLLLSFFYSD